MKPIAIVQHEADVGPGHFAAHLEVRGWSYELIRVFDGVRIPHTANLYSGICSLGGSMSVNDPLPWIDDEIALIRDADAQRVPVIGHCLGGQLIARAFGARVARSDVREIGWGRVEVADRELALDWLGTDTVSCELFQWHEDSFDLPSGARRVLSGALCSNQAFVIQRAGYTHLAMQFHVEMTPALIRSWLADPLAAQDIERERQHGNAPGVQSPAVIARDVELRTERMGAVATRLYDRWAQGLRR
jgi:GMP synthase-like glutamine amidotransferase